MKLRCGDARSVGPAERVPGRNVLRTASPRRVPAALPPQLVIGVRKQLPPPSAWLSRPRTHFEHGDRSFHADGANTAPWFSQFSRSRPRSARVVLVVAP